VFRIGIGYDIHRTIEGRRLFLGAEEIPYIRGLLGHSDGDAVLHAVCDAFLGEISEGDIGECFPDTEAQYQNISSRELLSRVYQRVKERGFRVGNIDIIVIAEEPMISPFKKKIRKNIAAILKIDEDAVGVKAKTNEGLGEIGRKEAIAAYAVALLLKETKGALR